MVIIEKKGYLLMSLQDLEKKGSSQVAQDENNRQVCSMRSYIILNRTNFETKKKS